MTIKKTILVFTFFLMYFTINAQDRIIMLTGDTLNVQITIITPKRVTYKYPNETFTNIEYRSKIEKIIFSSGRILICNSELKFLKDEKIKKKKTKLKKDTSSNRNKNFYSALFVTFDFMYPPNSSDYSNYGFKYNKYVSICHDGTFKKKKTKKKVYLGATYSLGIGYGICYEYNSIRYRPNPNIDEYETVYFRKKINYYSIRTLLGPRLGLYIKRSELNLNLLIGTEFRTPKSDLKFFTYMIGGSLNYNVKKINFGIQVLFNKLNIGSNDFFITPGIRIGIEL